MKLDGSNVLYVIMSRKDELTAFAADGNGELMVQLKNLSLSNGY